MSKSPREPKPTTAEAYGILHVTRAVPPDGINHSSADQQLSLSSSGLSMPRSSSSETSTEEDTYREKFQHLQILVRQLNRQLQSEKIRKDGIESLSRHLKEEREENSRLQEDNKHYKNIFQIFQSRLAQHGLPTSVETTTGEAGLNQGFVGQETFDSLVRENLSLKSELKYLSVDPVRMEDALKQNNILREQLLTLQQEVLRLEEQKHDVDRLLVANTDHKLQEIMRLRSDLEDVRKKGQTKDVLCQSLSEQSETLQLRLKETSAMCQQLLQRLQEKEGGSAGLPHPNEKLSLGSSFIKLTLNGTEAEQTHKNLGQIAALEAKLTDAISVNQNWQQYHDRREMEVNALQTQLGEAERCLVKAPSAAQLSEQQQEQIDDLILRYKRQIEEIEEEKEKILDENRQYRMQVDQLTSTNERLEQQLKGVLAQMRSQPSSLSSEQQINDTEVRERIQALEMQVKVCTEDFESERRDRQRAHGKIVDLEKDIQVYKSQLGALQRASISRINSRRFGNMIQCDVGDVNMDDVPLPQPSGSPHLIGRGFFESDTAEGEDCIDMPLLPNYKGRLSQDSDSMGLSSLLQCPQCRKDFPKDKHAKLLEHMEDCLK